MLKNRELQKEQPVIFLNPDQLNRLYIAKDVLLKRADCPPSLMELARQVGLNDYLLKRGFRQVFGMTVFGYLQNYRLEKAKQLLAEQKLTVAGVARAVGYASLSSFTHAFQRKFGMNPKAYQQACR